MVIVTQTYIDVGQISVDKIVYFQYLTTLKRAGCLRRAQFFLSSGWVSVVHTTTHNKRKEKWKRKKYNKIINWSAHLATELRCDIHKLFLLQRLPEINITFLEQLHVSINVSDGRKEHHKTGLKTVFFKFSITCLNSSVNQIHKLLNTMAQNKQTTHASWQGGQGKR